MKEDWTRPVEKLATQLAWLAEWIDKGTHLVIISHVQGRRQGYCCELFKDREDVAFVITYDHNLEDVIADARDGVTEYWKINSN